MKISRRLFAAPLFAAALALHACTSTNSPAPVPLTPAPSGTVTAPATGGTVTAVLNGGNSTTLTIPGSSAAITATISSGTIPPTGTTAISGTPLVYATITPAATTTFAAGGVVSGTFISSTPITAGANYQLALYVPGSGWVLDPTAGTISGNTLTFNFTLPQALTVLPVTYDIAISQI